MGAYQLWFVIICYHHNKILPYKHTWWLIDPYMICRQNLLFSSIKQQQLLLDIFAIPIVSYTWYKDRYVTIHGISKCKSTRSQPEYRSPHGTQCCLCSLVPISQAYLWKHVYKIRKCAWSPIGRWFNCIKSLNLSNYQYSPSDKAGWISHALVILITSFPNNQEVNRHHCSIENPRGKTYQFIEQRTRLTVKAWTMCTQNSTAIPIAIIRFTTDTALSWIPKIAITPCRSHKGRLFESVTTELKRM